MLLVIVGAGASYDSVAARAPRHNHKFDQKALNEYRPPLADELFENRPLFEQLMGRIPLVHDIQTALEYRSNMSVEDVLAGFHDRTSKYPRRTQHLAAVRFYIQAAIKACEEGWYRRYPVPTNMHTLIDHIDDRREGRRHPVFVTFNYDRMIESALRARQREFKTLTDYVAPHDGAPIFKLHGSVDWAREIDCEARLAANFGHDWQGAEWIVANIDILSKPGDFVITDQTPVATLSGKRLAIPAIAIPLKSKGSFECPQDHVDKLVELLPHTRTILTIGWRGAENKFLEMLAEHVKHPVNVICVAGNSDDAESTISKLAATRIRAHFEPFSSGFSQFVTHRRCERLLNITWD